MTRGGGCHCGAVRFTAEGEPRRHSVCHCSDCRRSAGAPMAAWALFAREQVRVERGAPKVRASSEHGRRLFCADCGCQLFYLSDVHFPGLIDVASATFDEPDALPPHFEQVQVAERLAWVADAHRLPAFDRYPDAG